MTLFNRNGVKITYNHNFNRLAVTCNNDFVSISPEIFQIWKKLSELDSDYERISMEQNGGTVEILKLCGNISLKFLSCKNFASQIVLRENTVKAIFAQYNQIITSIHKKQISTRVVKSVEGTVKPIRPNNPPGDVPPQKRVLSRATPVVRKSICPDNPPGDVGPQKRHKSLPIAGLKHQEETSENKKSQIASATTLPDSPCETTFNE